MEFINTCYETTSDVRTLSLYSHLLPAICSLILGSFAYRYATNRTKALLFFVFTVLLSLWLIGDLIVWTSNNYNIVAGFWAPLDFINILFYLFILCFAYVDFAPNRKVSIWFIASLISVILLPFILTVSGLAVHEFDEPNCEMIGNELLAQYKLIVEWLVIGTILMLSLASIYTNRGSSKELTRVIITSSAIIAFLGIFSTTEFFSTLTGVYEINLYALFALPLFILILTYTIIEQNTFRLNTDSIWSARILILLFSVVAVSNLFLADDAIERLTTAASTLVTLGFGILVFRSARREAKQRQEIEQLAKKLEGANERLRVLDKMKSEFVSIASHQLRSPLTSIRGYASMLVDGSFGKLPKEAKDAAERIADSSKLMAMSVEDYLNVSRIEAGNMKYELSDFNVRDMAEQTVDDLRREAVRRGLVLTFKSELDSRGVVHADLGKTKQILHNLIDNATKYTKKGSITVVVRERKRPKTIIVDITDTGIGMSPETIDQLFEKFERALNANRANMSGTGLGLYVARSMARGMGGDVTASSPGEGQGSTFTFTLPLQM